MVPDQQLIKWLTYADVDIGLSRFVGGDYIVTDAFTHRMVGTASTSMWQMEEWAVRALLVPFRRLKEAQRALTFHDLSIEPQWIDRKRFDFGVSGRVKGIPVTSWSFMREHRATGERLVEIQRDFITYHALDPRGSGNQYELVHPLDGLDVVRVRIERHAYYHSMLRLEVHRDYLQQASAWLSALCLIGSETPRRPTIWPGSTRRLRATWTCR